MLHSSAVTRPETGYVVNRSSKKAEVISVSSGGSQSLASVPYAYCQPHTFGCGFAELTEHDIFSIADCLKKQLFFCVVLRIRTV